MFCSLGHHLVAMRAAIIAFCILAVASALSADTEPAAAGNAGTFCVTYHIFGSTSDRVNGDYTFNPLATNYEWVNAATGYIHLNSMAVNQGQQINPLDIITREEGKEVFVAQSQWIETPSAETALARKGSRWITSG